MKYQKRCCSKNKNDVKEIGKLLLGAGLGVILIVCLPHVVWFVLLAVLTVVLGIKLFRY